jgi:hypothetical protein
MLPPSSLHPKMDKLVIVTQLVKKFPTFYGTQSFITIFTRARHWYLFWARWIQSTTTRNISPILLLSSDPRLGLRSGLYVSGFPTEILYAYLTLPRAVIAQSVKRWATGWTIGVLRFHSRRGLGIFHFTTASTTALGATQPPIQGVPGSLSLRVSNEWSYTSTPPYAFVAWCLVKAHGQLYIYLLS